MSKLGFIIVVILFLSMQAQACRFTVREIGFSVLSQDIYTIAVIDEKANPIDSFWKKYHKQNRSCNLRLEILNPNIDTDHPIVVKAKQQGIKFPSTVLMAPNQSILHLAGENFAEIYSGVIESPVRNQLKTNLPEVYAVVFWIKGKDPVKNQRISSKVKEECDAIENIMPTMPKIVEKGPIAISTSETNSTSEKVLLWSLGIDSIPEEPIALVLYGRGRIMGASLNYEQILNDGLYKYMSMIGADCECGLDRKWMLGKQIPLRWETTIRQKLTKLLSFDVDNPLILAEMSRILAKEKLADTSGSVAFAPETINLDEVFGDSLNETNPKENQSSSNISQKSLVYTLISLLVIILGIAGFLLYRKK